MPAYSTGVQNVITIHDQGNGISILNVWGSVCENRLFRAQILPFWFKSSYVWIECPGQWNLLRRDQARINPGLEQIQILLPSAWLGLRNLTDERSSGDKPGLGLINKVLPTARVNQQSIAYSVDKVARAEEFYCWLTKRGQDQGLGRSTYYFLLRGQVEQVIWIRVGETKQGWDHSLYLSTNQSWENAREQYCPEHILASLGNFLEEASERVFSDLREGAPLRVTASGLWQNLYGF